MVIGRKIKFAAQRKGQNTRHIDIRDGKFAGHQEIFTGEMVVQYRKRFHQFLLSCLDDVRISNFRIENLPVQNKIHTGSFHLSESKQAPFVELRFVFEPICTQLPSTVFSSQIKINRHRFGQHQIAIDQRGHLRQRVQL